MDKTNLFLNKSSTMNHELNYFYNSNWENSMDHQNDPFESALSSIVSSPVTSNVMPGTSNGGDNFVLKELIGKLGSICNSSEMSPHSYINSTTNSCYTTPLNSPPRLNLSILDHQMNGNYVAQEFKESEFLDSRENSTVSEQIPLGEIGIKYQNDVNSKKKKSVPKRKAKDTTAKVSTENNESNAKRSKSDEKNGSDNDVAEAAGDGNKKQNKDNEKPAEPPKDYIHVRARRGQATDAHSLAERVRREKIGERMKFLQDLVPGCNKVTGKAVMLDEIINYVQSLQRQVEFLSMKLATLDSRMDFNMESLVSKDLYQSVESLHHNMHPSEISAQGFPYGLIQSQQGPNGYMARNVRMQLPYMDGFVEQTPKVPTFFEDDLHSITQMGFGQIQPEIFPGNMSTAQMKVEL